LFASCFTRIIRHYWTRPPGRLDPDAGDQSRTIASSASGDRESLHRAGLWQELGAGAGDGDGYQLLDAVGQG